MNPVLEMISTGSELLSGRTLNTHAQSLARHLEPVGWRLVRDTTVPDDLLSMKDAIRSALNRVDVVMVSGGLGPTSDDITRDAIAELLGRTIILDDASLELLKQRYRRFGGEVKEISKRQALVVEGATVLPNPVGISPGERIEWDDKVLFVVPGPPREFEAVVTEYIIPWLAERHPESNKRMQHLFLTCGIGESAVADLIVEQGLPDEGVDIAYCAAPGRIEIRLESTEVDSVTFDQSVERVRDLLSTYVFSEERELMEAVVGRLLKEQGKTLVTAESCTGGLLGNKITSVSGSSDYYLGGVIAYANRIKTEMLGVPDEVLQQHGAVSEEVACAMACGVMKRFGADYGIGITGVAGPTGGTEEKPVGTVYAALASSDGDIVKRLRCGGGRKNVQEWSAQLALNMLRLKLESKLG